jgi:hypothetical protein
VTAAMIPDDARAQIEQLAPASLVIALPHCGAESLAAATELARSALLSLPPSVSAALLHCSGAVAEPPSGNLRLLDLSWTAGEGPAVFVAASRLLDPQACVVIGSDPAALAPAHLSNFIDPALSGKCDLVVARYPRRRFESLINTGIVYPLLRSLYGKRVEWPMAADFALSRRAIDRYAAAPNGAAPVWIVAGCLAAAVEVCQANLPRRPEIAQAPADLGSTLAQVLGPIFFDMERNAPLWQKIRGSQPVATLGSPARAEEEPAEFDASCMIESFQLGFRNLQEIWSLALTPATLLALKKVARLAPEDFRMPDELWARVVYDFALAWRLRVMNRDQLLRALTPAYLGWVASYALQVRSAPATAVEDRIEHLCRAYEADKPYLQSRWRWPDRFNP